MKTAESPLKPLAWAIVFAASVWLVIAGANHGHSDTSTVMMGVGLFTGLVAMFNINSWRWVEGSAAPERKDMTPE